MTPDMADADETARARDERASTVTVAFHADTSGFDRAIKRMTEQMAATAPTRREAVRRALAPFAEARPFTDFHREWLHVMDTQRPHTPQESDMPTITRTITVRLDPDLVALLTEIRDRLPERVEAKVAPFDPDVIAADITEEPPVGSQVTDREGDVWEQVGAGWQVWDRTASMWGGRTGWGSSVGPRSHAPLRPTTDADRVRVGLPVEKRKPMPEFTPEQKRRIAAAPKQRPWTPPAEPAPGMTRCDTCGTERPLDAICPGCDPAPADVDPDEALAAAMEFAFLERDLKATARAAREHILTERGGLGAQVIPALKRQITDAEADLARVTEERDVARSHLNDDAHATVRRDDLAWALDGADLIWQLRGADPYHGRRRRLRDALGMSDDERAES